MENVKISVSVSVAGAIISVWVSAKILAGRYIGIGWNHIAPTLLYENCGFEEGCASGLFSLNEDKRKQSFGEFLKFSPSEHSVGYQKIVYKIFDDFLFSLLKKSCGSLNVKCKAINIVHLYVKLC